MDSELASQYYGKMFTNNSGWSAFGFLISLAVVVFLAFLFLRDGGDKSTGVGFVIIFSSVAICFAAGFMVLGSGTHRTFNGWMITGIVLWIIVSLGALGITYAIDGLNPNYLGPVFATLLLCTLTIYGFYLLKAPSREGQQIRDQINGFREYLSVAEEDRLNFANPPKKTPELFEKFLPYAIALDVENEWGKKFAAVLAAAAAAGAAYAGYRWYSGNRDWSRDPVGFSNHIGSSLASTISSASTAPGSSSGSSGGGSSGGGGGGGGGGGW